MKVCFVAEVFSIYGIYVPLACVYCSVGPLYPAGLVSGSYIAAYIHVVAAHGIFPNAFCMYIMYIHVYIIYLLPTYVYTIYMYV